MSQTTVYLLAAGRGRRAGAPKAWLEHEGKPLLQKHLDFLPYPAAVAVQAEWLDRCRALSPKTKFVAADPDAPAFASLLTLLKAAPPKGPAFVYHVDHPLWNAATFAALEKKLEGSDAAVPEFKGRRGHPVLLSVAALADVAKLDARTGRLDEFLRGRRVAAVPVSDAAVLENWNEGAPAA